MIKKTTHYELSKPDYNETADIEVINSNMDIIDGALHGLKGDLEQLEELEETVSYVSHGKNLIGTKLNKLYPVYIKANEKIVSSRYDGQVTPIMDKGVIAFYDKNKSKLASYSILLPNTSYRVLTLEKDAYYIAWETLPSVDFQVEMGNVATSYEPYNPYGNKQCLLDVKNDLDKLNALPIGTIIQIEADKDTIATTEAKYSWQYLGTSNIQYENGGAYTLEANVYRKNN